MCATSAPRRRMNTRPGRTRGTGRSRGASAWLSSPRAAPPCRATTTSCRARPRITSAKSYATGFEWMGTGSFNMIRGLEGRTLKEKWEAEGTKTFLGMHSAGFPNLFIMNGPQGGGGQFNFTRVAEMHAHYIVWALQTVRAR